MRYQVREIFNTIAGEGRWIGHPTTFIRMGRCNLTCDHCDTDYNTNVKAMEDTAILKAVKALPVTRFITISGGEPLAQNLAPLIAKLAGEGYSHTHIETNGTFPLSCDVSWICVSPKLMFGGSKVDWGTVLNANEIKFPIRNVDDLVRAERFRRTFNVELAKRFPATINMALWYLHPWNDNFDYAKPGFIKDVEGTKTMKGRNREAIKICVDHALETGRWLVSIQGHKALEVP